MTGDPYLPLSLNNIAAESEELVWVTILHMLSSDGSWGNLLLCPQTKKCFSSLPAALTSAMNRGRKRSRDQASPWAAPFQNGRKLFCNLQGLFLLPDFFCVTFFVTCRRKSWMGICFIHIESRVKWICGRYLSASALVDSDKNTTCTQSFSIRALYSGLLQWTPFSFAFQKNKFTNWSVERTPSWSSCLGLMSTALVNVK